MKESATILSPAGFSSPGFTVIGESESPEYIALKRFMDLVPGFHEFFLARTRYIDDCLKGFNHIECITSDYFNSTYFTGTNKNREATSIFSIAHTEV